MERNFAPGILPVLDLEDLGDEILDFWTYDVQMRF